MAMAARGGGRGGRVERHHIGTIANKKSSLRGGPWTQRFEELFARAGMRLNDAENIVPIQGHKGPHPERYHQIVCAEPARETVRRYSTPSLRNAVTVDPHDCWEAAVPVTPVMDT